MIAITESIDCIITPTALEAQVRELRLIQGANPRYNRRSRFPEKVSWLSLTDENYPRLKITKGAPKDPAGSIGPINGGGAIESALAAVHEHLPLRQCKPKITDKSMKSASPCVLFEINKCGAPCIGNQSLANYQTLINKFKNLLEIDFREISELSNQKMRELSMQEKFEEAIEVRDRYSHFLRAASRIERLNSIARIPEMIVAKPFGNNWEFIAIRFGKLAATNVSSPTTSVNSAIADLQLIAEQVPNSGFLQEVNYEEVELILNYLEGEGVRLVKIEGEYSFSTFGPNSHSQTWVAKNLQSLESTWPNAITNL